VTLIARMVEVLRCDVSSVSLWHGLIGYERSNVLGSVLEALVADDWP
jgi:hypothetical protein